MQSAVSLFHCKRWSYGAIHAFSTEIDSHHLPEQDSQADDMMDNEQSFW